MVTKTKRNLKLTWEALASAILLDDMLKRELARLSDNGITAIIRFHHNPVTKTKRMKPSLEHISYKAFQRLIRRERRFGI